MDSYTSYLWSGRHQLTGVQMCSDIHSSQLCRVAPLWVFVFFFHWLLGSLAGIPTQFCPDPLWRDFLHERHVPGAPRGRTRDSSRGCVSAAHNPLTHYKSFSYFLRCVSVHAEGAGLNREDREWPTYCPLAPHPTDCDVSLPRCLMWRPLTFGWRCVSCLCLPPCWSTPQSTLSRGNTKSSSGWGKSSGSRG